MIDTEVQLKQEQLSTAVQGAEGAAGAPTWTLCEAVGPVGGNRSSRDRCNRRGKSCRSIDAPEDTRALGAAGQQEQQKEH